MDLVQIIHSVLMGVVEGVTEFLPISSTFHLILASKILGLPQNDFWKLFEVFIQGGAVLAVLSLYWRDLVENRQLLKTVMISFLPTAIVGFILYKVIKDVFFESDLLMLSVFLLMGIVFFAIEHMVKNKSLTLKRGIKDMTTKDAVLVGLFQSLAVIPGVSRSGATIVAMMGMKYKRGDAAKYSFILSVPTILAASGYDLLKMRSVLFQNSGDILYLAVGFVVAFISAYIVVKWFLNYLKNHSLEVFGWYRVILVIFLIVLSYLHR